MSQWSGLLQLALFQWLTPHESGRTLKLLLLSTKSVTSLMTGGAPENGLQGRPMLPLLLPLLLLPLLLLPMLLILVPNL